jgi:8-oxo-dGTP pyrophosphatase MutT (NUDIX family)
MPDYMGVVPGGGIEEGESVAETAVREVKEETGIDAVFVRELGVAENPVGHYVHLAATSRLPESWEHDGRACRWEQVSADLTLWGLRGDFVHALVRRRVVAYVTRGRALLVFDYEGLVELPAGRIDAHESLEEGLVREVEEETGLADVQVVGELADVAEFARLFGPGVHESHALHAMTEAETPESWDHHVTGTGMDSGIVYRCRWVHLDDCPPLWGKSDPLVERLRMSITER